MLERRHVLYASAAIICAALFAPRDFYRANPAEPVMFFAGCIFIGALVGPARLRALGRWLLAKWSRLPSPAWVTPLSTVLILVVLIPLCIVADDLGFRYSHNDWIELPLRIGTPVLAGLFATWMLACLAAKFLRSSHARDSMDA